MLVRLVKLTFHPQHTAAFLELFNKRKTQIRHFPGCRHLELLQADEQTFFTLSHWDTETALEQYRHSPLFMETWAQTRQLFAARPEAWSTQQITTSTP